MVIKNSSRAVRITKLRKKSPLGIYGVYVRDNLDGIWWDRGLVFRAATQKVAILEGKKLLDSKP